MAMEMFIIINVLILIACIFSEINLWILVI